MTSSAIVARSHKRAVFRDRFSESRAHIERLGISSFLLHFECNIIDIRRVWYAKIAGEQGVSEKVTLALLSMALKS